jgi:integrase
MYSMAHFVKAHARACERIGLTVSKGLGTTPHGHRHAYGRRLVAGGFSQDLIRRFMHHANLESQVVYTTPTSREIMDSMSVGLERMNLGLNAMALN